ncbi:major facilitator superfamily transporter 16 isoform X2 [Rhodnius prolixus]|uniref:major facilitator superfamily transporter 16 isoform X2 n=1 Tax=Rhodnius prolixus TaxID=13249 RepID=UPI003D189B83
MAEVPLGIKFIQYTSNSCSGFCGSRFAWFKASVFFLTFATYAAYHATRKPLSVVKSYFNRSCDGLTPPSTVVIDDHNRDTWCDWEPFYGPEVGTILGVMDSAFLFAYAVAMFASGFIAERISLRYFLAVGMITSGISCYLFGIAYKLQIHNMWYFILVQIFGGVVQTTGWPGVVAVMGNWFGKGKRGLIFGLWNSHTSLGNVLGTLIASYFLETNWGMSFIIPGLMIAIIGFINFLFLVENPEAVGCISPNREKIGGENSNSKKTKEKRENTAIGFLGAVRIPGVIEFSLCLFFSKLVNYTFLYWLTFYINSSTSYSASVSAEISTTFDIGGILGGIFAGVLSDYLNMSAVTCAVMLALSIPSLLLYNLFGTLHLWLNILLLSVAGFLVNGPYALITTAVSAELGTHPSLLNNSKALATVTAIIDGTGSIGAAVGPLLAGVVYSWGKDWKNVFYMLILSNVAALIMLLRLVKKELSTLRRPVESRINNHHFL